VVLDGFGWFWMVLDGFDVSFEPSGMDIITSCKVLMIQII